MQHLKCKGETHTDPASRGRKKDGCEASGRVATVISVRVHHIFFFTCLNDAYVLPMVSLHARDDGLPATTLSAAEASGGRTQRQERGFRLEYVIAGVTINSIHTHAHINIHLSVLYTQEIIFDRKSMQQRQLTGVRRTGKVHRSAHEPAICERI